ncbi:hypothetical protein HSIEG1_191 [Enterococcus sp. HSIEG1]|nr:hypothetical protein HSIEG1_191 [Enterococcus sp. HSIEG1]
MIKTNEDRNVFLKLFHQNQEVKFKMSEAAIAKKPQLWMK